MATEWGKGMLAYESSHGRHHDWPDPDQARLADGLMGGYLGAALTLQRDDIVAEEEHKLVSDISVEDREEYG